MYIADAGIVSPLGTGLEATEQALLRNRSAIGPMNLFPLLTAAPPLPVGQVRDSLPRPDLPRSHRLALAAATQAMRRHGKEPDAIVLGTTTGGILTTEELLRQNCCERDKYRYHGLGTIVDILAAEYGCDGPVVTISTACSSGAVAIALACKMLRRGMVRCVLAGGVDSLCRLTYFGFPSLQLVDPERCRPLDRNRHGMAVAEAAGFLLLTSDKPDAPLAEVLGAGLSCDAYHPTTPDPEGRGAARAMEAALANAGLSTADIDYINLHGTGTKDNDLAESRAILSLFPRLPPVSSIKGATGHSLAAAGVVEAVVAIQAVAGDLLPANTGCREPDPELAITPIAEVTEAPVGAVLSNSFGFGGNNCSLVIAETDRFPAPEKHEVFSPLAVHGLSCLSGAGNTEATLERLQNGQAVIGKAAGEVISRGLDPGLIRRLKQLPRMAMSLARQAVEEARPPSMVIMGTGWGALTETHDFLDRLYTTDEQFPSPTDFVGSVHNGPAGQVAIMLGATGANITTSGGDCSFEQALLAAELEVGHGDAALVLGADEFQPRLSPLLEPSLSPNGVPAEGGGALHLSREHTDGSCLVRIPFLQGQADRNSIDALLHTLGGSTGLNRDLVLLLVGIPAAARERGEAQLQRLIDLSQPSVPLVRYRDLTGEFASASALAAVLAASLLEKKKISGGLSGREEFSWQRRPARILVLGLGDKVTAMELSAG